MYKNIAALVMEDNDDWREIFTEALKEFGIGGVDSVAYMSGAIELLKQKNYQILLLDTNERSGISGPKIAARAIEIGQKPLILAASSGEKNELHWRNLGFEYTFVNKNTFDRQAVYKILKEKLNLSG